MKTQASFRSTKLLIQVSKLLKKISSTSSLLRATGFIGLIALGSHVSALQSNEAPAEASTLTSAKSRFFDEFSIADEANLASYTKVYIEQPTVSFDERWLKDNRVQANDRYKERTKKRYAEILHKQLSKAFSRGDQYTLVDSPDADDVLVVAPVITKLDIHGPDFNNNVQNFVFRAGDASFEVELRTKDGKALAKIKDHRETFERGIRRVTLTNRVLNQREFRRLMSRWSRQTVKHIAAN